MEGQAVLQGRVVEMEPWAIQAKGNALYPYYGGDDLADGAYLLYRPKQHTDAPKGRTPRPCDCEDAWCPHTHGNDEAPE